MTRTLSAMTLSVRRSVSPRRQRKYGWRSNTGVTTPKTVGVRMVASRYPLVRGHDGVAWPHTCPGRGCMIQAWIGWRLAERKWRHATKDEAELAAERVFAKRAAVFRSPSTH